MADPDDMAKSWPVDLDGTEAETGAVNGKCTFNGEVVSDEKMQALGEAVHFARVEAARQRSIMSRRNNARKGT